MNQNIDVKLELYDLLQCTIYQFGSIWTPQGTPGYTAYILLHRSLIVLSVIFRFCTLLVKEFIIHKMVVVCLLPICDLVFCCKRKNGFSFAFSSTLLCIAALHLVYFQNLGTVMVKHIGTPHFCQIIFHFSQKIVTITCFGIHIYFVCIGKTQKI